MKQFSLETVYAVAQLSLNFHSAIIYSKLCVAGGN